MGTVLHRRWRLGDLPELWNTVANKSIVDTILLQGDKMCRVARVLTRVVVINCLMLLFAFHSLILNWYKRQHKLLPTASALSLVNTLQIMNSHFTRKISVSQLIHTNYCFCRYCLTNGFGNQNQDKDQIGIGIRTTFKWTVSLLRKLIFLTEQQNIVVWPPKQKLEQLFSVIVVCHQI